MIAPSKFPGCAVVEGNLLKIIRNSKNVQIPDPVKFDVLTTVPGVDVVIGGNYTYFDNLKAG